MLNILYVYSEFVRVEGVSKLLYCEEELYSIRIFRKIRQWTHSKVQRVYDYLENFFIQIAIIEP